MKNFVGKVLRPILVAVSAILVCNAEAAESPQGAPAGGSEESQVDLTPHIHGAFRARWEGAFGGGDGSRFQVRNARVTLSGSVAPTISYFVQTDLCDRGKMKILDAWGRLGLVKGLSLQAGQFREPFGTDCFRGPANYIFANRSFLGKYMCNVRAVGAKLSWTAPLGERRTIALDGGAFNPTSMADHDVWVKTLSYAAKGVLTLNNVKVATGFQTIVPDSVRTNLWGASLTWQSGRWTLEGEYMHKHYVHRASRPAHSWVVWGDYALPVKVGVFNRASLEARWDGITSHSSGSRNAEGVLTINHPARQRITVGGTLSYVYKSVRCDIRLDYERYFSHSRSNPAMLAAGDTDKLLAELVICF